MASLVTTVNPNVRELLWAATRAAGVVTGVFDARNYTDHLFQIIGGAGTYSLQIQCNLTDDLATDANWQPFGYIVATTTVAIIANTIAVPALTGVIVPQIRAKLISFTSGTPRVFVASRLRR